MKKISLFLILILGITTSYAQRKINYGVGIDVFQTKLNNVEEAIPGYKFQQNDRLGFGVSFLAQAPIYKNLSFETGIGISNFRSQFQFDYPDLLPPEDIDSKLNISLYYLNIPLMLNYNFQLNQKSAISLSGGINTRFLFAWKDNYQEIINVDIYLPKDKYRFLITSPQLAIGYSKFLKNGHKIRLEGNAGFDLQTFTFGKDGLRDWGFYKQLTNASYTYYGIGLKYFLGK